MGEEQLGAGPIAERERTACVGNVVSVAEQRAGGAAVPGSPAVGA